MIAIDFGDGGTPAKKKKPLVCKDFLFPFHFDSSAEARIEVELPDGTRVGISDVTLDKTDPQKPVFTLEAISLKQDEIDQQESSSEDSSESENPPEDEEDLDALLEELSQ